MAARELDLLENVLMSFALADTPEKLQKSVTNLLPAVLQMLKAPQPSVQKKVSASTSVFRETYNFSGL